MPWSLAVISARSGGPASSWMRGLTSAGSAHAVWYGDATGRRPPGSQPDAGRRGWVDNPAGATQSPVSGDPTRIGSRTQMREGLASDLPGWSGTATPNPGQTRRLAEIDQVGWRLVMMNPLGGRGRDPGQRVAQVLVGVLDGLARDILDSPSSMSTPSVQSGRVQRTSGAT